MASPSLSFCGLFLTLLPSPSSFLLLPTFSLSSFLSICSYYAPFFRIAGDSPELSFLSSTVSCCHRSLSILVKNVELVMQRRLFIYSFCKIQDSAELFPGVCLGEVQCFLFFCFLAMVFSPFRFPLFCMFLVMRNPGFAGCRSFEI